MGILSSVKRLRARYRGGEHLIKYLKAQGMRIGNNCRIFCDISTSESYLVEIGDNVTVSGNVTLITHDASIQKAMPDVTDLFGKIKIGNNCFIGHGAIIMYGVTIPDNTIIAAGSVVTKSISVGGKIVGGNPARIIGDIESFAERYKENAVNIKGMTTEDKKKLLENDAILVVR